MDYTDDEMPSDNTMTPQGGSEQGEKPEDRPAEPSEAALVKRVLEDIRADKAHHENAFKRMRADMHLAMYGADKNWGEDKYRTNIAGRHVKNKTAALYAKNPKVVARRRETLDFQLWDESEQSLMLAMQTIEMASTAPPVVDPETGIAAPPEVPGFAEAQALIADFQQGYERRTNLKKFGRTLEILFAQAMREQKPLDFKQAIKKVVRRACTTGVGYVELGFQREKGPAPVTQERLADSRARLEHLQNLLQQAGEGEIQEIDAEMRELEASIASLVSEPEIVLREGLIFDFPQSTKVIPDRLCKSLVGFIGARHVTVEYNYTIDQIKELFGVDLGEKYTPYMLDGKRGDGEDGEQGELFDQDAYKLYGGQRRSKDQLVCVWKMYDKTSGLVYYVADGYDKFLREPAAPEVFVSDFWPLFALTFNDIESEEELYPPSDVYLLRSMQAEYNRSRQGKREHRQAARPRWGYANGAFDENDVDQLKTAQPFDAIGLNIDPSTKLSDVLQAVPVPGVDPNLYDTGEIDKDIMVSVGAQSAQMGVTGRSTATEAAVAANAMSSSDASSVDDLDAFLSAIARASSQILMREMSAEQVMAVVGVGAYWPEQTTAEISDEIYLEVEAGSTGKPNQGVELNNWKEMMPYLLQMGSIQPTWLARETLRRLDDRMDLTEAVVAGLPSIVAMNAQKQLGGGTPDSDPNAQGDKGANNGPQAPGNTGTDAPMGDNNPTPPAARYGDEPAV